MRLQVGKTAGRSDRLPFPRLSVNGADAPLRVGRWRDCFQLDPVGSLIDMLEACPHLCSLSRIGSGSKLGCSGTWVAQEGGDN